MNSLFSIKHFLIISAIFIAIFIGGTLLSSKFLLEDGMMFKVARNCIKILYSFAGIAMALIGFNIGLMHGVIKVNHTKLKLSRYCFGVYLFQQFVLEILYNKTTLLESVGSYWLPWIGFLIALPLSLALAWGTNKTKIGRFIVG